MTRPTHLPPCKSVRYLFSPAPNCAFWLYHTARPGNARSKQATSRMQCLRALILHRFLPFTSFHAEGAFSDMQAYRRAVRQTSTRHVRFVDSTFSSVCKISHTPPTLQLPHLMQANLSYHSPAPTSWQTSSPEHAPSPGFPFLPKPRS